VTNDRIGLGELTTRWHRADAALWRRTLVGVVVLPPQASEPLVLSGPAAGAWERLGRPVTREALHLDVMQAFGDHDDSVKNEIDKTLGRLSDLGGVCRL
jgi:hypothetical protein